MPEFKPFTNFEAAASEALKFLHNRFGFGLWMVTRTEGEDWIVLYAEDQSYGVKRGAVFRWTDSFCSRMVNGLGPCVAPDSKLIPSYEEAPIGRQVTIGAYIGIPLRDSDGQLFGTLCAIDPLPQNPSLESELPLIRLIGRLLSTCITYELKMNAEQRAVQHSELCSLEKLVDLETGALLPAAWSKVVAAEEGRCKRLGAPACVIHLRLSTGQPRGASAIAETARELLAGAHVIARMSDDEFMILLPECNEPCGKLKKREFEDRLATLAINVKISSASRDPRRSLEDAVQEAQTQNT